eukprot:12712993-Ditylum_brightwellii.AAC.1
MERGAQCPCGPFGEFRVRMARKPAHVLASLKPSRTSAYPWAGTWNSSAGSKLSIDTKQALTDH